MEEERLLRAASGLDSPSYLSFLASDSNPYVHDDGNFTVDVLARCLRAIDVSLDPLPASTDIGAVTEADATLAFTV